MGGCCNARTLSYISASFQLTGWIIAILAISLFGVIINSDAVPKESDADMALAGLGTALAIIVAVVGCIAIAFLVTLIVGIKQNRVTLVSIYVYATIALLTINALLILYGFVMGFVNKLPVGTVFLNLFVNLIYAGIYILMFSPIFILHRRMRHPHFQPEQHDLRGNQPVHKPHYGA